MNHLNVPDKLYGRDKEISLLLNSFEKISRGYGEVLLIPGTSGVGKTALVQELQIPIVNRNGFFISGKFDQYQQNIPYFAFRQAFLSLLQEIEKGDEHQGNYFREEMNRALGIQGQLLIDMVPEYESFLGAQPPLDPISPQEARHRFNSLMINFLDVVCRPEQPVVLFLDDWQWADSASFELLNHLQVGKKLRYLLVIVSYRNNEVGHGHPLNSTIDYLHSQLISVKNLEVKNITVDDVGDMLSDTLKPAAENIDGLAKLIHDTTKGNPFFVKSLLQFLSESNSIWFDKDNNSFKWEIDSNSDIELPKEIVQLFVIKLSKAEKEVQTLYSLAACLGNRFNLETLSLISSVDYAQCRRLLNSDQVKELVKPLYNEEGGTGPQYNKRDEIYSFQHDRIQQAAFSLIDPEELPKLLLKIGRLLLSRLSPENLNERIFEVLNDLNAGFDLMIDRNEKIKLIELNIKAARKAFSATAYGSALQYYRMAYKILSNPEIWDHQWEADHNATLDILKERAECEFLEGDRNLAEQLIQTALENSVNAIEKADILNILIVQYTLQAKYPEAINAGKAALTALGINLPDDNFEAARDQEISRVNDLLKDRQIPSLFNLPKMSNPEMLTATKILITMGPPCYRSHQRLWSVMVPKVVYLTLEYGNIPQVGYSHTAYGGLLGWVNSDFKSAREFSELATRLMTEVFQVPAQQSVFYLMIGSSIRHWFKHLKYGSKDYINAYEIGLRSGNLQYAAYAFGHNMYCSFFQGINLEKLESETKHSLEFSKSRHNQWAIDLLEGAINIFHVLNGDRSEFYSLADWKDDEYLERVASHQNIQVTCIYKVLKTFSLFILENEDEALALSEETEPIIYTVGTQGLLPWPEFVITKLLLKISYAKKLSGNEKSEYLNDIKNMTKKLRIWADNCKDNFEHKYLLVSAELAVTEGNKSDAIHLYDRAIEECKRGNFIQWEGIANELAHKFWLENGNGILAFACWQRAYLCYKEWGAEAKIKLMEDSYKRVLLDHFNQSGDIKFSEKEDDKRKTFIETQLETIRNYAYQIGQSKLRVEAEKHAEELANATENLRVEIAARKRTEGELRETRDYLESLIDNANAPIVVWDPALNITRFNKAFEELTGYSAEVIRNNHISILFPEYSKESTLKMIEGLKEHQKLESVEIDILRKDNMIRTVIWSSANIYSDDGTTIKTTIAQGTDITDRILAENKIKDVMNNLEVSNKELEQFAYVVSHDLQEPLRIVSSYTKLLEKKYIEKLDDTAVEYINYAVEGANRMSRLIRDLLEYSRITTRGNEISKFSLTDALREAINNLFMAIEEKNVVINHEDLPTVYGDQMQISRVFQNLIGNSIKYCSEEKPVINISAKRENENIVVVKVSDNGIGFDQKFADNVFAIFRRLHTRDKYDGTGIGLAICKRVVEKHGGKIWAESEPAAGSNFYFTLKMAPSNE